MRSIYLYFKLILFVFALSFYMRKRTKKNLVRVLWIHWIALAIFLIYVYKVKVVNLIQKNETSSYVNVIVFYIGQLAHLMILVEAIWKWKSEKDFFALACAVDKRIQELLIRNRRIEIEVFKKVIPFFGTTSIIFSLCYGLAIFYSSFSSFFYDWVLSFPVNLTIHLLYFQIFFYLFYILLRMQYLNTILEKNQMQKTQDICVLQDIYIIIFEMTKIFNHRFFWCIGSIFLQQYANLLVETYWIVNYFFFNSFGMFFICKSYFQN